MSLIRYTIGRWLIHAGLMVLPPGIVRSELRFLIAHWGVSVRRDVAAAMQTGREHQ